MTKVGRDDNKDYFHTFAAALAASASCHAKQALARPASKLLRLAAHSSALAQAFLYLLVAETCC